MGIFSKSSDNAQGNYDNIPIATAVAVPISHAAPVVQEVATTLPVTFDLGRNPVQMNCPMCKKQNVTTRTKTYPNWMTWAAAAGMALIFWPVFWIPLVIDPAKKTEHYCSNCHENVGTVQPFSDCCVTKR